MVRSITTIVMVGILHLVSTLLVSCGSGGGGGNPPPLPATLPEAPSSVIATAVSGSQIDISWSSVSGATSYSVYRSEQSGTAYMFTLAANTSSTVSSDTTVTAGSTYYYVVTASNSRGEGAFSAETSATPVAPSGTLTIQGTIRYEDKEYDMTVGLNGNTSFKAVRFAEVELVDTADLAVLATAATDSGGVYSISTPTANAGKTVYVSVLSTAAPTGANAISVMNLAATTDLYAVKTADFPLKGDSTVNLSIPVSNTADGAFNILDVFVSGFEFVNTYAGTPPQSLNAFWQPVNSDGTYYCHPPGSNCARGTGIYVYSNYDTDEFDDDVLWHEFGHFIAEMNSKDDSPDILNHVFHDNTQDIRLSWSEGWGSFLPLAIKNWLYNSRPDLLSFDPGKTPIQQYVDTETGGILVTINIGSPETDACYADECKYATNEISVANVLWHIMTDAAIPQGMQKIWDVFDNYLPNVTAHPVNIEDFWDGLLASYATDSAEFAAAFADRLIDYSPDGYEADDAHASASSFTVGGEQHHLIYGDGDQDYAVFSVPTMAQYTIRTEHLRNGADTFLTLFDGTGTFEITNNDNAAPPPDPAPNDTTTLSSEIVQTLTPGTYYVSVKSAPTTSRPLSAGRYGKYRLTITSP